jgi:hypothetical protein
MHQFKNWQNDPIYTSYYRLHPTKLHKFLAKGAIKRFNPYTLSSIFHFTKYIKEVSPLTFSH